MTSSFLLVTTIVSTVIAVVSSSIVIFFLYQGKVAQKEEQREADEETSEEQLPFWDASLAESKKGEAFWFSESFRRRAWLWGDNKSPALDELSFAIYSLAHAYHLASKSLPDKVKDRIHASNFLFKKCFNDNDQAYGQIESFPSTVYATFFGLSTKRLLLEEGIGELNKAAVDDEYSKSAEFILSCQDKSGGFGEGPGMPPTVGDTYAALSILGRAKVDVPLQDQLNDFLESCICKRESLDESNTLVFSYSPADHLPRANGHDECIDSIVAQSSIQHRLERFGMADDVVSYENAAGDEVGDDGFVAVRVDFLLGVQEAE